MPDNRRGDLCAYRMAAAQETLQVAKECLNGNHYKDAIIGLIMLHFML